LLVALAFGSMGPSGLASPPKLRLDLEGVLEGASDPDAVYKVQFLYLDASQLSSPFSREAEVKDGRFQIRGIQPEKVYRVIVSKRSAGTKQMLAFPQGVEWSEEVPVGEGSGRSIRLAVVERNPQALIDGQQHAQLKFFYDGKSKIVLSADPLTDANAKL
jgi:hypothetical protein